MEFDWIRLIGSCAFVYTDPQRVTAMPNNTPGKKKAGVKYTMEKNWPNRSIVSRVRGWNIPGMAPSTRRSAFSASQDPK